MRWWWLWLVMTLPVGAQGRVDPISGELKDPVTVTVAADPRLRGGTMSVREPGGAWQEVGPYVGFHDAIVLENHVHYEVKVEKPDFWSIAWGSNTITPISEADAHPLIEVEENETALPNTPHIVLVAVLTGLPVLGLVLWGWRRLARGVRRPHELTAAEQTASRLRSHTRVELPADLRIGQYHIIDLLGEGGMASVYKVADGQGRLFAMKIPYASVCQDDTFVKRFRREVAIAVTFRHPHIIQGLEEGIYRAEEGFEVPYLVMELALGKMLDAWLDDRSDAGLPPDIPMAFQVGKSVAEALAAAHQKNIVHRDIKPSNVIIDDRQQIKVLDFGIARVTDHNTVLTTGGAIGTPAFMAPEQLSHSRPVDARADLYALGVTLYCACTYEIPFWHDDVSVMVMRKLTEVARPARELNPRIPPALDAIIRKLMWRKPDNRFRSAVDVLAALEQAERSPERTPLGCENQALEMPIVVDEP
ncbi:MAG TPA: serine/threonine-protein kinase [Candidatus Xenobia bacterium]|jgi:hypothetical protein